MKRNGWVAASLEPGATVSEVARMAGLHVSQLFRWRNELCKHGETSIAPLVPVEIEPSVPPRDVAEAPLTRGPARRRRTRASSRSILVADTASGAMATLMETRCAEFSMPWCSRFRPACECGSRQATRICAEAFRRWHFKCRRCCAKTRSAVICSSSAVAAYSSFHCTSFCQIPGSRSILSY
ncbi:transposase [Bradyrhizobium sp. UFLA01-814]|uniref:transposase n=1 Tax=Bradyrhizobium sp. UFLA01-814 TaxID=3023480 RepID=UPI00398B261F